MNTRMYVLVVVCCQLGTLGSSQDVKAARLELGLDNFGAFEVFAQAVRTHETIFDSEQYPFEVPRHPHPFPWVAVSASDDRRFGTASAALKMSVEDQRISFQAWAGADGTSAGAHAILQRAEIHVVPDTPEELANGIPVFAKLSTYVDGVFGANPDTESGGGGLLVERDSAPDPNLTDFVNSGYQMKFLATENSNRFRVSLSSVVSAMSTQDIPAHLDLKFVLSLNDDPITNPDIDPPVSEPATNILMSFGLFVLLGYSYHNTPHS